MCLVEVSENVALEAHHRLLAAVESQIGVGVCGLDTGPDDGSGG